MFKKKYCAYLQLRFIYYTLYRIFLIHCVRKKWNYRNVVRYNNWKIYLQIILNYICKKCKIYITRARSFLYIQLYNT